MIIFIKGLIIGGTMLVPGVSGGTMAMILGVYDKLISAVSSFANNKIRNFKLRLTVLAFTTKIPQRIFIRFWGFEFGCLVILALNS